MPFGSERDSVAHSEWRHRLQRGRDADMMGMDYVQSDQKSLATWSAFCLVDLIMPR